MMIKSEDGHMYDVASNAKANTGVALGAVGTGLGILGCHFGGFGGFGNGRGADGSHYVTKDELDYVQTIARKDAEIALLKSEQNTEVKIADVYERLAKKMNENQREQDHVNREQAVYNGVNSATVMGLKSQIDQLMGLTALRIPNTSVCPGWGEVKVEPVPPTA